MSYTGSLRVGLLLFCISLIFGVRFEENENKIRFTMMTFNVWVAGSNVQNGFQKIANHIKLANADIVALQEMQKGNVEYLVNLLNSSIWSLCENTNSRYDNVPFIITRLEIVQKFTPSPGVRNVGCQIRLIPKISNMVVNIWDLHMPAYPYGPYDACLTHTAKSQEDLMKQEFDPANPEAFNRMNALNRLLKHHDFANILLKSHYEPVIVAGDFNSPSHLDWIKSTRTLDCNMTFEWPVTKTLYNNGFYDSYRVIYPDPASHAGNTWSPIYLYSTDYPGKLEPSDRIDMILYKGNLLRPVSSRVYDGSSKIYHYPYHGSNDWPSDHSSVITEFDLYRYS